ncbi:MAG TPA: hypothetical protein VNO17_11980 [Actinomycetota bacterium]|nr:hypothetical protein [Actinomycetota bacterium]
MDGHGMDDGAEPIVYIDRSEIRAGGLEELKAGIRRLVAFLEPLEPRLLSYGFHIDEEAATMTVVAVHPDPASLELHLEIGGPQFRRLAHLLTLTSIECYGRPSERALEQLRRKAAALGDGATILVVGRFTGFTHLGSTAGPPRTARGPGADPDEAPEA